MADDHATARPTAFDLDTDEGWKPNLRDLETRHPVPNGCNIRRRTKRMTG